MRVASLLPAALVLLGLASAMPLQPPPEYLYPRAALSSGNGTASAGSKAPSNDTAVAAASVSANSTSTATSNSTVTPTIGVTPTSPGPGMQFKSGGLCTTTWAPDTSGGEAWKSMEIALMTGSNLHMTKLAVVLSGVDGTSTSQTSYTFRCPDVSPYAAIYFLQFTPLGGGDGPSTDGVSPAWTTRFAISDPKTGIYYPAPEANQPEGGSPPIPWGEGKLNLAALASAATATTTASPSSSGGSGSRGAAAQAAFSSAYAPGTAASALLKAKTGGASSMTVGRGGEGERWIKPFILALSSAVLLLIC